MAKSRRQKGRKGTPNRMATRKPSAGRVTTPSPPPGDYMPGRLRASEKALGNLLASATPESLVPMLVPFLWLHHVDGLPGNMCIDAAFVLRYAYEQFGLQAELMPVNLVIENAVTGKTVRHGEPNPGWEGGQFTGHCVLRLPGSARFVDVTAEQYLQIARLRLGPIIGRVAYSTQPVDLARPIPSGTVFAVRRENLNLIYTVAPPSVAHDIENHVLAIDAKRSYRRAGINLASHALMALRHPDVFERARQSPYPRLHAFLDAVTGESHVDDAGDWRYLIPDDSGELKALRLDEIPLPADLPPTPGQADTSPQPAPVAAIIDARSWPMTEDHLVNGWEASPGVQIRQARPSDLDIIRRLAKTARVDLDDELADAVTTGSAGTALRAGLRGGQGQFMRHMAERFAARQNGKMFFAYLSAALFLVAEDAERNVIGALVAHPPPNVANAHLDAGHPITDPQEQAKIVMVGGIAVAKVTAVAVAEPARRRNIGSALVGLCMQIYAHCGYVIVYGQMPAIAGLDLFYRNLGFTVLDVGAGIDMWVVFGIHSYVYPDPGSRMFLYNPRARST